MQAIPKSSIEAAAIGGARPLKRFRTIVFPPVSPTTFFPVGQLVCAFFDTFAIIQSPEAAQELL